MIPTFGMDGTKWRIFEAAVSLFSKRGYHAVSMRDIAAEVNIKTSSIYNHFPSKEELLTTMYNYYWEYFYQGHPKLEELLAQVGRTPPAEILGRLVNYREDGDMDEFMHQLFTIAAVEMYSDERAKKVILETMYDMPRRFFVPLFQRMVDLGIIQPLDVDSYLLIHSSLCHATTLMTTADQGITWEQWARCHEFLMESAIRVLDQPDQTAAQPA